MEHTFSTSPILSPTFEPVYGPAPASEPAPEPEPAPAPAPIVRPAPPPPPPVKQLQTTSTILRPVSVQTSQSCLGSPANTQPTNPPSTITYAGTNNLWMPAGTALGSDWYLFPALPVPPETGGAVLFEDASGQHVLRSIDGNLFFDTELLAKASDIQNVADWALFPALANVDVDGQTLETVGKLSFQTSTAGGVGLIENAQIITGETDLPLDIVTTGTGTLNFLTNTTTHATMTAGGTFQFLTAAPQTTVAPTTGDDLTNKTYVDGEITDVSGRIDTLQQEVTDISGRVGTLEQEVSDISGRVDTLQLEVTDISGRVDTLQLEVTDISGRVDTLQLEVTDISGRVATLEQEIIDVSGNISQWSTFPAVSTIDASENDINNVGSFTAGGVLNSFQVGTALAPVASAIVRATNLELTSFNPVEPMSIVGVGGINITGTDDINITANDVNISATGLTDILNVSAVAGVAVTAGAGIGINAGGGVEIAALGTIQILSTGNISIGSGNVLGADTEIEKFAFNDEIMSRVGLTDLELQDIGKINGFNYIPAQEWATQVATDDVNFTEPSIPFPIVHNIVGLGKINGTTYAPTTQWSTFPAGSTVDVAGFDISGVVTINGFPYVTTIKDNTEFYVSAQGSNTNTGGVTSPFLTIQHAINQAALVAGPGNPAIINVAPGVYTENLTFTTGYITVTSQATNENLGGTVVVNGTITVSLGGANDLFGKIVSFIGFQTGAVLDNSTAQHSLAFQNCFLFAGTGGVRVFHVNSTCTDQRVYLQNCTIQGTGAAANAIIEINNPTSCFLEMDKCDVITSSNIPCLLMSGASRIQRTALCSFANAVSTSNALAPLITLNTTGLFNAVGNCTFLFSAAIAQAANPNTCGIFFGASTPTPPPGAYSLIAFSNLFVLTGTSSPANNAIALAGPNVPVVIQYQNGAVPGLAFTIETGIASAGMNTVAAAPAVTMTQYQVDVSANTADMDTGPQLLGPVTGGNYSIGSFHVTTNGIISSVKITVPNVYVFQSAGNWFWEAEVSGSTSNSLETWTVVINKFAPEISTAIGVVGP